MSNDKHVQMAPSINNKTSAVATRQQVLYSVDRGLAPGMEGPRPLKDRANFARCLTKTSFGKCLV